MILRERGPVGRLLADAFAPGVDLLMFHEAPADPVEQERWNHRAWDEGFRRVNDPWHARYGWGSFSIFVFRLTGLHAAIQACVQCGDNRALSIDWN